MTSTENNDASSENEGGWIERLTNDGFVQRVLLGKQTSRALNRLLAGAIDIPAAGLENVATRIRSNTDARKRVASAIGMAAAKRASKDPALIDRALTRLTADYVGFQEVREDLVRRAHEQLSAEPPPAGADAGPSDDFIDFYAAHAERASSEALRDLFARVLAGEIRRPGSFSLRTIQFLTIMDQSLAATIQLMRPWVLQKTFVLAAKPLRSGEHYQALATAGDLSILRHDEFISRTFTLDAEGRLALGSEHHALIFWGEPNRTVDLPIWPLTQMGQELMSIVPCSNDTKELREIGLDVKNAHKFDEVMIGRIKRRDDPYFTVTEVEKIESSPGASDDD